MRLVRLKDACCGMHNGHVYEGEIEGYYARVYLPPNPYGFAEGWTDWHWMPEFFQTVQDTADFGLGVGPFPRVE